MRHVSNRMTALELLKHVMRVESCDRLSAISQIEDAARINAFRWVRRGSNSWGWDGAEAFRDDVLRLWSEDKSAAIQDAPTPRRNPGIAAERSETPLRCSTLCESAMKPRSVTSLPSQSAPVLLIMAIHDLRVIRNSDLHSVISEMIDMLATGQLPPASALIDERRSIRDGGGLARSNIRTVRRHSTLWSWRFATDTCDRA